MLRSEGKKMSSEPLLSSIIPFAGSGVAGFFMGDVSEKSPEIPCNNIGSLFVARLLERINEIIGKYG